MRAVLQLLTSLYRLNSPVHGGEFVGLFDRLDQLPAGDPDRVIEAGLDVLKLHVAGLAIGEWCERRYGRFAIARHRRRSGRGEDARCWFWDRAEHNF